MSWISFPDQKVYIVLACITYKNIILFIIRGKVLVDYKDLFLSTVYILYENNKRIMGNSSIGSTTAL
jgi:hypothetical protein